MMNVACGGTLIAAHARRLGHEDHRAHAGRVRRPRRASSPPARWRRARPAGERVHATKSHHHQGVDAIGDGFEVTGWATVDDLPEAIEDPVAAVRARRAVAPGGRPGGSR